MQHSFSFFEQQKSNITMVQFDIVEFFKVCSKISNEDSADGKKEVVTLENFTGTVIWPKQSSIWAGIEKSDDDIVQYVGTKKDAMAPFQQQQTTTGSLGIMKTGISAIQQKYATPASASVAVKEEKHIKVEPGTKNKASVIMEPEQQQKTLVLATLSSRPLWQWSSTPSRRILNLL
jgi:hypothetical protein